SPRYVRSASASRSELTAAVVVTTTSGGGAAPAASASASSANHTAPITPSYLLTSQQVAPTTMVHAIRFRAAQSLHTQRSGRCVSRGRRVHPVGRIGLTVAG